MLIEQSVYENKVCYLLVVVARLKELDRSVSYYYYYYYCYCYYCYNHYAKRENKKLQRTSNQSVFCVFVDKSHKQTNDDDDDDDDEEKKISDTRALDN